MNAFAFGLFGPSWEFVEDFGADGQLASFFR
jgi:hypothetical protein